MDNLYTLSQAGKKCGVSESYMRKHLAEFRVSGLVVQLYERRSDRAKLIAESDVIRLRNYLVEEIPQLPA